MHFLSFFSHFFTKVVRKKNKNFFSKMFLVSGNYDYTAFINFKPRPTPPTCLRMAPVHAHVWMWNWPNPKCNRISIIKDMNVKCCPYVGDYPSLNPSPRQSWAWKSQHYDGENILTLHLSCQLSSAIVLSIILNTISTTRFDVLYKL